MLKPTIFREYDIRGVAESELQSLDIAQLGCGLGTYLQRQSGKNINLGRDCRLSSSRLRDALCEGLLATGCDVTDIGTVPTPVPRFPLHAPPENIEKYKDRFAKGCGGMGFSMVGMLIAAAGYLPLIAGAVGQELIDVAAVLNAVRVALPSNDLRDDGV